MPPGYGLTGLSKRGMIQTRYFCLKCILVQTLATPGLCLVPPMAVLYGPFATLKPQNTSPLKAGPCKTLALHIEHLS